MLDRVRQPAKDSLADQEMPDVELDHLRHAGDGANRLECQPVAGVDLDVKFDPAKHAFTMKGTYTACLPEKTDLGRSTMPT